MTPRHSLLAALIAAATALVPATAGATLTPVFGPDAPLGAESTSGVYAHTTISHGRATVVWRQDLGDGGVLVASHRDGTAAWSTPVQISTANEIADWEFDTAVDCDGNVTAVWNQSSTGALQASTLKRSAQAWSAPATLAAESVRLSDVQPTPDGGMLTGWASYDDKEIYALRREPNSSEWSDTPTVIDSPEAPHAPEIAVNAAGDAVLVWAVQLPSSDWGLFSSRFSSDTGTWSAPGEIDTGAVSESTDISVALTDDNHATVVWVNDGTGAAMSSSETVDRSAWSAAELLSPSGLIALGPSVQARGDNSILATFQSIAYDPDPVVMYGTSRARFRIRDADSGVWSSVQTFAGTQFSGGVRTQRNRDHDIVISFLASETFDSSRLGEGVFANIDATVAVMPDGSDSFVEQKLRTMDLNGNTDVPAAAIDDDGNVGIAMFDAGDGQSRQLYASVGDGAAPELEDVAVPASAIAGQQVSVSVNPFDLWSSVQFATWDFGDGGVGTGTSASHTYSTPGTRTVAVTVTDAAGHSNSETRQIAVAAPPAPPAPDDDEDTVVDDVKPKPPVVTPPVLEVRLAGKTLTYNVKLTLKKGKSCTGKVQVGFTYGNKRYRSNLKLKKVGTICRATGKTTLKKTPSTRTKIKVKISGKQVKSRSLSSKRG